MSEGKGLADDTTQWSLYLKERQAARWQYRAEEMGYNSYGGFVKEMVEAGMKQTAFSVEPDKTNAELRDELATVKKERDRARKRNQELEDRLHDRERTAVVECVEENPDSGISVDGLTDHLRATVPSRLNTHLDELAGDVLEVRDGKWYPREDGQTHAQQPRVAAQQGGTTDE